MLERLGLGQGKAVTEIPPYPVSSPQPSQRRALHLLWILPVVAAVDLSLLAFALIAKCGVGSCDGGGFGGRPDPVGTAAAVIIAGLLTGSALMFFPWAKNRIIRAVAAVASAIFVWYLIGYLVY